MYLDNKGMEWAWASGMTDEVGTAHYLLPTPLQLGIIVIKGMFWSILGLSCYYFVKIRLNLELSTVYPHFVVNNLNW